MLTDPKAFLETFYKEILPHHQSTEDAITDSVPTASHNHLHS